MNDIKPKSVFEQLTERGIKFQVSDHGDGYYYFMLPDQRSDTELYPTWADGVQYFQDALDFDIEQSDDKSASGDGGEGF